MPILPHHTLPNDDADRLRRLTITLVTLDVEERELRASLRALEADLVACHRQRELVIGNLHRLVAGLDGQQAAS